MSSLSNAVAKIGARVSIQTTSVSPVIIPVSAAVNLAFDKELIDEAGAHDNAVNNDRITIPVGYNRAKFNVLLGANANVTDANAFLEVEMRKNDISTIEGAYCFGFDSTLQTARLLSDWLDVIPGDYFTIRCNNSSAVATYSVKYNLPYQHFSAELLRV